MQAFELSQLLSESERAGEVQYDEFLRHPSLSMGVYSLAAGALDPQQPHTEDEVYYIVSGQGSIRVGNEQQLVKAGTVVFVAAKEEHRFFNITEDLTILVFFAPAEQTLAAQPSENRRQPTQTEQNSPVAP
jgi:mannose-6-phosphate isomerase-like protein (cupin superfamily)